jgi:MinD superfamily P-loop ATPase
MMKVAIASGKGGTGKTTVSVNLALSIEDVQLIDCDVEEPNCLPFLPVKTGDVEDVHVSVPLIDMKKCNLCGECSKFCRFHALATVGEQVLVFTELCHWCGGCQMVCPMDAITEKRRAIGVIESGSGQEIHFIRGILKVGEIMATPIITALKKKIAREGNVILDSPPGTSCPVIETIEGADFCLLVTEPTPFGLHDLKLAVGVVRTLGVPFGVVINRDGVGDDGVERYCREEGIRVLMKIPQSMEIARLYSQGKPFVPSMPEWGERFRKMWKEIEGEVEREREDKSGGADESDTAGRGQGVSS